MRHSNESHEAVGHVHLTYIVFDGSLRATQQYGIITDICRFAGGMLYCWCYLRQAGPELNSE